MADEPGKDGSSSNTTRTRKVRPEIQIYRPGMMRKGTDVTASGPPPNDSKPPSEPPRQKRPSRISLENSRGGARAFESTNNECNDTNLVIFIVVIPGAQRRMRRRRAMIEETVLEECPERGLIREVETRHTILIIATSQVHRQAVKEAYAIAGQIIAHHQARGIVKRSMTEFPVQDILITLTQSLYDPQQPEGYLNYRSNFTSRGRGAKADIGRAPSPVRFKRTAQINKNERSSMRAEGGQRRNDRLHIDTNVETRSVAGDAPPSPSLSYMQLCQSFESIGSFDWSREVESEYNAKHGEEKEDHSTNYQERGETLHNGSAHKDLPHGDGPHSSFSMRGILRIPPGLRSDRGRNRNGTPQLIKSSAGYSGGGDDVHKENRGGRLMGRVTVDRSRREPNANGGHTACVAYHSSSRAKRAEKDVNHQRCDWQRRTMLLRQVVFEEMTAPSVSHSNQPRQMTDYPVYHEIARNQGPKMQKINDTITSLLTKVQQRDVAAAEKIVQLSSDLCEIYYGVMLRDIYFTFSMNLEQHLWKQAFYKPIEVFKSMANSPKDSSRLFRSQLLLLLNKGIAFYERLIALYEKELDVDVEKAALFQFDSDENFWNVCLSPNSPDAESSRRKTALKSCSRHLISLGDLKRYRTLVEGSEGLQWMRERFTRVLLSYGRHQVIATIS
ncbi:hypothetical protein OSTOST_08151 [Ostertagia ostertagi]